MTELNGTSLLLKIILLIICLYKIKVIKKNKLILFILLIIFLHTILHTLIIVASLPKFCDSSNFDWKPGNIFNKKNCHIKYQIYYATIFWLIETVSPLILLIIIFNSSKFK